MRVFGEKKETKSKTPRIPIGYGQRKGVTAEEEIKASRVWRCQKHYTVSALKTAERTRPFDYRFKKQASVPQMKAKNMWKSSEVL